MLRRVYKTSPTFVKNTIKYMLDFIPFELRLGNSFWDTYKLFQESQWWPLEKHLEYQFTQTKALINHAYNNVPYYNEVFKNIGFEPEDFTDISVLKKLPYLTRAIIIQNADKLIATNYKPNKYVKVTTGGTTGMPLCFFEERNAFHREWGFIAGVWRSFGYKVCYQNRSVILRGESTGNKFYRYQGNNLILSSFQLTEKTMYDYVNLIEKFNPEYIKAYPSSISVLAEYIVHNKIHLNLKNLKAIICSSEYLLDSQRTYIEKAFNKKVHIHYGHSEKCCLGIECELSNYYHLISEYGYTEIINSKGNDVSEEDELGEIVSTGFNNYVMPFIRYKTGDIAVNTQNECDCGRKYKIVKRIEGRIQNFFVDSKGALITMIVADKALWKVSSKLNAYQYVQNEPGKLILNIEEKEPLSSEEISQIKKHFLEYYPLFVLEIQKVNTIQRTKSGKFEYLIQNISTNFNL